MTRPAIALAVVSLVAVAPTSAHSTKVSWNKFDTEQRLSVGRFAAAHGITKATCLGVGSATNPKASDGARRYKHLECAVYDKSPNKRHLVVHVRTETTFTHEWLTTKECAAS